jgi:2-polyprenyl-6-methoxyphenol hydroxylase-like FAD-dependent oxidoreductase
MAAAMNVVIVGAGPAGAALALLLVQRGIAVRLVEATRTFHRLYRGEGFMPSGLDALQQMGLLPVLDRIPHRPLDAWEFWINGRRLFRVEEPIVAHEQPCTLISQSALLTALIEMASAFPHFELIQGTPVQELTWVDQRVAGVKLRDGRQLAADLVIGTDGRNSVVRQRANLTLAQQSKSFDVLWFKLADSPLFESENIFYSILQDRHAFGLFRSSEGNLQLGWALHTKDEIDRQQVDWAELLASASPAWLAEHFRTQAATLEKPVLLSVLVGRCPQWSIPGLLLLGDAAHPMSPIRAQGINMALRDVIVATNHLVPLAHQAADWATIDATLPKIQAEREPEIVRIQWLQAKEVAQADLLEQSALLRWGVSQFASIVSQPVRLSWLHRQRQLRRGATSVRLEV